MGSATPSQTIPAMPTPEAARASSPHGSRSTCRESCEPVARASCQLHVREADARAHLREDACRNGKHVSNTGRGNRQSAGAVCWEIGNATRGMDARTAGCGYVNRHCTALPPHPDSNRASARLPPRTAAHALQTTALPCPGRVGDRVDLGPSREPVHLSRLAAAGRRRIERLAQHAGR